MPVPQPCGTGITVMDLNQIQAFQAATQAAFQACYPMTVRYNGVDIPANGTTAGHVSVRTEGGGRVENRDAAFAIDKLEHARLPMNAVVTIQGQRYIVRKIWGEDAADVAYSYRAEQWTG